MTICFTIWWFVGGQGGDDGSLSTCIFSSLVVGEWRLISKFAHIFCRVWSELIIRSERIKIRTNITGRVIEQYERGKLGHKRKDFNLRYETRTNARPTILKNLIIHYCQQNLNRGNWPRFLNL